MKQSVYWYTLQESTTESLQKNQSCDVAVIGGGMAGLMCAHELVKAGKSVILLECDFVGGGASGKSSGFITPDSELELSDVYDTYGEADAKRMWDFVTSGVEDIRRNILDFKLECDYQKQDSLFIGNGKKGYDTVAYEHEVRLKLGYDSALYNLQELPKVIGSVKYSGGVSYSGTFGMNSFAYCQSMKKVLLEAGVQIFEHSPVTEIKSGKVLANGFEITAKHIVVCADYWLSELGVNVPEIYHAQTFLGITKPLPEETVKQLFPKDTYMVWDTDLIYQYYRMTGDNRLLIGGSSLLYTYQQHAAEGVAAMEQKLLQYLKHKFPKLAVEFEYLWPGLIGVSKDFLPIAGIAPTMDNVYYVGAAAGLPWAAALGKYIAQKIISNKSDMDSLFSAERKFIPGKKVQAILGQPITFALAHSYDKFIK